MVKQTFFDFHRPCVLYDFASKYRCQTPSPSFVVRASSLHKTYRGLEARTTRDAWSINERELVLIAAFAAILFFGLGNSVFASGVFFSEYVEGSGYNKALEICNGTSSTVDLEAGGYRIEIYFNGNTTATRTVALPGVLAGGEVFVAVHSSADAGLLERADLVAGGLSFNGDDAVVLRDNGGILDIVGTVGVDPGASWGTGDAATADRTLRRRPEVVMGDGDPFDAFDPSREWVGFPKDAFEGLGFPGLDPAVTVEAFGPLVCVEGERTSHPVSAHTAVGEIAGFAIGEIIPPPAAGSVTIDDFRAATSSTLARAVLTVGGDVPAGDYVAVVSAFNDEPEPQSGTDSLMIQVLSSELDGWAINEILADPPLGLEGDANGDGVRDASEDEFVEIVNLTGSEQDITSWTLSDSSSLLHVFPADTRVSTGGAVVVFGGGAPAGGFGGAVVQTASTGRLSLNNDGDTIYFTAYPDGIQAYVIYGSEGGRDESLNLDPDLTGPAYGLHSKVAGSGGTSFSPGARSNGTPFGGGSHSASRALDDCWVLYE